MAYTLWPGYDPTTVNQASNTAQGDGQVNATLGSIFRYYHSTYGWWLLRWMQAKDAITYAAGQSVQFYDNQKTQFTNDRAGGAGLAHGCAGIVLAVLTTAYFAPVLIRGYYPTVLMNTDDNVSAGNAIIVDTSVDGKADAGTSTPALFIGTATADDVDANDTCAVDVCVLDQSF